MKFICKRNERKYDKIKFKQYILFVFFFSRQAIVAWTQLIRKNERERVREWEERVKKRDEKIVLYVLKLMPEICTFARCAQLILFSYSTYTNNHKNSGCVFFFSRLLLLHIYIFIFFQLVSLDLGYVFAFDLCSLVGHAETGILTSILSNHETHKHFWTSLETTVEWDPQFSFKTLILFRYERIISRRTDDVRLSSIHRYHPW